MMHPKGLAHGLALAFVLIMVGQVISQRTAFADGTLWQQPSILGYQGGLKDSLKDAGIDLSMTYTQFYQGLVGGEGDRDWEAGGKTDVMVNFDGHRLGLWPGLYISAHAEFINGANVLSQGDGSVLPVNTALAFPTLGGYDSDLSLVITQVFSEDTTLSIGKINVIEAAAKTPLVGGGGLTTFFNLGLAAPASGVTPPYILGGILSHSTDFASFKLMVYDPRSAQNREVLEHPFEDGVTTSLSVTVPVTIGGKQGYQGVRAVYSTLNGTDFRDIPELILPGGTQSIGEIDGYWFGAYSFQQYLVQDAEDPSRGWGIFGQAAVSDGNPNPFGWSALLGLGGSSLLPGRPDDTFGIAYFYYGFSDELQEGLEKLSYDLDDESGIEAFYNAAITPWMDLTADGQVIWPADGDEPAYFLGLRAQFKVF